MRTQSIIAHFPQLGGPLLGSALLVVGSLTLASQVVAAPAAPAGAAAPAAGAPDAAKKKAAREAYSSGEKAYTAGDYTTALSDFTTAHDLIPTIHAEYWMAMCESHGSDMGMAFDALTAVVASPDAEKLGEEKLSAANARLAELRKMPATVNVSSTPPGAEVSVDGAAQPGVTPTTLSLTTGTHHLGVALAGHDVYEADVAVRPGQKLDQAVDLKASAPVIAAAAPAPVAAPPPPPPAPVEEHSRVPAYITLGVGVVGAGVGTFFGISALSAKNDFNKNPTNSGADKAERDALIADMGFAVALTLGITGIVLLSTGDSTSEVSAHETTAPRLVRAKLDIAPVITPSLQGAAARVTF